MSQPVRPKLSPRKAVPVPISIDLTTKKKIDGLIKRMTKSGSKTLDNDDIKLLKSICKASESCVDYTYELLVKELIKKHSQIRYSTVLIISELFERSHNFRLHLCKAFPLFVKSTLGLYNADLPEPHVFIKDLKALSAQCIQKWYKKYGVGYKEIRLAYDYLNINVRLDFSTGNIRPSLQQQKKIDDEEKRRLFIRERRLKLVKKDFLTIKPLITGCLEEMNLDFKVLVPDLDNLFQDLQSDDESDEFSDTDVDQHGQKQPDFPSEYDDSDEELESIMAVMNTNRHIIEIDLNPKTLYDIDDTDKDTSFQRERLSTNRTKLRVQFLPVIHNWQVVLTRIDCKELDVYKQLFESIEQVKKSVEDAMAKCIELSIEERKDIELPPIESLESIDKKKIGTRPIHASVPVSKEVEVDPTVVQGISKKISFIPKGLKASSNTNEEKEGGERSIEQKPKESIPIIDVLPGDFLEEGGELNAGFEVSHRIFGSSRDAPVISKEALRKLSRRYVKYSPSNTEPKRKCRHPLPNGKLCDIECILQCSQHGRVISRDEKGRPAVSGGFILPEDEKADPTIEEPSSDTKDAPEVVTVMGKGEKKSSGSKSKSSSGLQSKRKRPDSGISKLKKIINSPEALKKEAEYIAQKSLTPKKDRQL